MVAFEASNTGENQHVFNILHRILGPGYHFDYMTQEAGQLINKKSRTDLVLERFLNSHRGVGW